MEQKDIGAFLAQLRKEKNMTQRDVARFLNVSDKSVSRWERGDSYPDITILSQLAQLFSVSCDAILAGKRDTVSSPNEEIPQIAPEDAAEVKKREAEQAKRFLQGVYAHFKTYVWVYWILFAVAVLSWIFLNFGILDILFLFIGSLSIISASILLFVQYRKAKTTVMQNELKIPARNKQVFISKLRCVYAQLLAVILISPALALLSFVGYFLIDFFDMSYTLAKIIRIIFGDGMDQYFFFKVPLPLILLFIFIRFLYRHKYADILYQDAEARIAVRKYAKTFTLIAFAAFLSSYPVSTVLNYASSVHYRNLAEKSCIIVVFPPEQKDIFDDIIKTQESELLSLESPSKTLLKRDLPICSYDEFYDTLESSESYWYYNPYPFQVRAADRDNLRLYIENDDYHDNDFDLFYIFGLSISVCYTPLAIWIVYYVYNRKRRNYLNEMYYD